jgi:DNA-binding winged helix-turn-helix (wHTH) protein
VGKFLTEKARAVYREAFCSKCVHTEGCPIMAFHIAFPATPSLRELFLDAFIPHSEHTRENLKCVMYYSVSDIPKVMPPRSLSVGPFTLWPSDKSIEVYGTRVELTTKEFDLFFYLAERAGSVCRWQTIWEAVWGYPVGEGSSWKSESSNIRFVVRRIRGKIEPDPSNPKLLLTKRGLGYMLRRRVP